MWFDEDCDRGDWLPYAPDWAGSAPGGEPGPRPRKYPEWAAGSDSCIIREMTQEELEAEFARLWDEADTRPIRVEPPSVCYMHTWRGLLLREGSELNPELVSRDHDVADAFCDECKSVPVVSDDELTAMLKDEYDKLVSKYREEAHRHLAVGYLAHAVDAYGQNTDRTVACIHPEARPDAAFRNIGTAVANLAVLRVKEIGRGVVAEVEKAVKAAKVESAESAKSAD